MATPDDGYLYAVCGSFTHLTEAITSIRSCRAVDAVAHATIVVTPDLLHDATRSAAFDACLVRPSPPPGAREAWLFKAESAYVSSPYRRTMLLDSDTYFLGTCRELFDTLEFFDLAMAPATADRAPANVNGRTFPAMTPFNSGVLLFRKTDAVRDLFGAWASHYRAQLANMVTDQQAFVEVLATSGCRVLPLQNNWNVRIPYHEKLFGVVRLIHGRHHDLALIGRRLNTSAEDRVWVPWLEACVGRNFGAASLLRGVTQVAFRQSRRALRLRLAPLLGQDRAGRLPPRRTPARAAS